MNVTNDFKRSHEMKFEIWKWKGNRSCHAGIGTPIVVQHTDTRPIIKCSKSKKHHRRTHANPTLEYSIFLISQLLLLFGSTGSQYLIWTNEWRHCLHVDEMKWNETISLHIYILLLNFFSLSLFTNPDTQKLLVACVCVWKVTESFSSWTLSHEIARLRIAYDVAPKVPIKLKSKWFFKSPGFLHTMCHVTPLYAPH